MPAWSEARRRDKPICMSRIDIAIAWRNRGCSWDEAARRAGLSSGAVARNGAYVRRKGRLPISQTAREAVAAALEWMGEASAADLEEAAGYSRPIITTALRDLVDAGRAVRLERSRWKAAGA